MHHASLEYEKSRLVRSWKHLERQRGGFGFLGGPGETQLETDRRLLQERISTLKQQLTHVEHTRALHRNTRRAYPKVALVGYTNAGKSTLFNSLCGAKSLEADALFATLDPTMRNVTMPSHSSIILSDTVGFITNLPTELIAAFKATLEEVVEADLILHVCDISHPEVALHKKEVIRILKQLNVTPVSHTILEIHNKIDLVGTDTFKKENTLDALAVEVSAKTKEGLSLLLHRIEALLHQGHATCEITLDASEGKRLAWLYQHTNVQERHDTDNAIILHVEMTHDTKKLWDTLPAF